MRERQRTEERNLQRKGERESGMRERQRNRGEKLTEKGRESGMRERQRNRGDKLTEKGREREREWNERKTKKQRR
jgi:hypothetical protein